MTSYVINIGLDNNTLTFFNQNNIWLRVYKGEATSAVNVSTVWFTTNSFASSISVTWTNSYAGFICPQVSLNKGSRIQASVVIMQLGDLLNMNAAGITSLTTNGGEAGALTFENQSYNARICGAAQMVGDANQLYMATPMLGQGTNMIVPNETILLVFESGQILPGTIVNKTLNPSLLISLNTNNPSISVNYDYLQSWNPKGSPNAEVISGPILIANKLRTPYIPKYIKKP